MVLQLLKSGNDWGTKKIAVDVVYSLAAIVKEDILPFRRDLLRALGAHKFDKNKPVREAVIETLKFLKELGPLTAEEKEQT